MPVRARVRAPVWQVTEASSPWAPCPDTQAKHKSNANTVNPRSYPMKTDALTASQMRDQISDIDDILRCTDMFPEHPLAATARPGLLAQRRALEQALARLA